MKKYFVYADNASGKSIQIKKCKHEYEAMSFATDIKNLAEYGCMTVIMKTDDGDYVWDALSDVWNKETT
jgi:hypothetical protein